MNHFLKIVTFAILVVGLFTAYSNFGIPQIQPQAPPVQEDLDLSNMDMESFIILGEQLFNGKGTCTLCHNAVGGRAPMLDRLSQVIQSRLENENYKGKAVSFEEYAFESMVDPSAYVVSGFGKMGNAEDSPMPDVRAGSIGLSEPEIVAVIAYLQDLNGVDITVKVPADVSETAQIKGQSDSTATSTGTRKKYNSGGEIITALGCGVCHTVGEFQGEIGPNLSRIGRSRDREHLRKAILDPNADITEGYAPMMPPIYGDQLYASELEILVDYMSSLK